MASASRRPSRPPRPCPFTHATKPWKEELDPPETNSVVARILMHPCWPVPVPLYFSTRVKRSVLRPMNFLTLRHDEVCVAWYDALLIVPISYST